MKKSALMVMTLALALSAVTVMAQNNDQPSQPRQPRPPRAPQGQDGAPGEGGQRGPRGPRPDGQNQGQEGQRPMVPPIIAALDVNNDGVIDEKEIANAAKALKKLDKNGDGKLTMDELRPAGGMRPQQGGQGPDGANGPRPRFQGGQGGPGFRGNNGPDDNGGDRPVRRGPPPQDGQPRNQASEPKDQ